MKTKIVKFLNDKIKECDADIKKHTKDPSIDLTQIDNDSMYYELGGVSMCKSILKYINSLESDF